MKDEEIPDVGSYDGDVCYALEEDIDLWLLKGWYIQKTEKKLLPGHVLMGKKPDDNI